MEINFQVSVDPRPMPRPRFSGRGAYTPRWAAEYKSLIREAAKPAMAGREPMMCELSAQIRFYRRYKRMSRRFGDADNLFKAVADALNGVVYGDDAQLSCVTIEKHTDKENPRVEIELRGSDKE